MDSISFIHAATPILAPTMMDAPADPNLDLLRVQRSGAAPYCENYVKFYFIAKNLEKRLNSWWGNFWFPFVFFFSKKPILANIESCPNFLD